MKSKSKLLWAPPGFPVDTERSLFWAALGLAQLWSLGFMVRFYNARESCYLWQGGKRSLLPDAAMPRFFELVGSAPEGFVLAALCMAALILWHIHYYYQGSRSIYLMRRLPQRGLLESSILLAPLCRAAVILLAGAATLLVYALIYRFCCPPLCMPLRPWAL